MILGRPVNVWSGTVLAVVNLIVLVLAALTPPIVIPAVVVSAVGIVIGSVIALIANAPPTLSPGDTFTVQTASGQPNYTTTVAHPPSADKPPVPDEPKP